MQLKEILSLLKTTPMYFNVSMTIVFVLALISFLLMLKAANEDEDRKFNVSLASLIGFALASVSLLVYTDSAKTSAIEEAKITRSEDKIHIESHSEFMKSADLDVVAEKDGYIYVEFENKTYRIEDLSKKGN